MLHQLYQYLGNWTSKGEIQSQDFKTRAMELNGPQWINFSEILHAGIFSVLTKVLKVSDP